MVSKRSGGGVGVDFMKLMREEKARALKEREAGPKRPETEERKVAPQRAVVGLWLRQGHHDGDVAGAAYYLGDQGTIDVHNAGWLANLRHSLGIAVGQPGYAGQWMHIIAIQGNVAHYESYAGALEKGNVGGVAAEHVAVRASRQNLNTDDVATLEAWVVQHVG